MTLGEVITNVVADISLEPVERVRETLTIYFESMGRYAVFTDQLTEGESRRILMAYRKDPSEILSLYASAKASLPPTI